MSNKSAINVEERQDAFLKVNPTAGTITSAAKAIGVNRRTVHTWFKTHPEFSERFEQARQGFVEELENIAYGLVKEMADNRDYKANPTLLISFLTVMPLRNTRVYPILQQKHGMYCQNLERWLGLPWLQIRNQRRNSIWHSSLY